MNDDDEALERLKAALQAETKRAEMLNARNIEQFKALVSIQQSQFVLLGTYATLYLRTLITLNAGAIIGLLTFVGNLYAKESNYAHRIAIKSMPSIATFVAGLILSIAPAALWMMSQAAFLKKEDEIWLVKFGTIVGALGVLCSLGSLIAFSVGALTVARALSHTVP